MDSEGVLVFDVNVNDNDEGYLGHFTWHLQRLAASLAVMGWTKAMPDDDIAQLIRTYQRAYLDQVHTFVDNDRDHEWSLRLGTARGAVHDALLSAQLSTRRTTLLVEGRSPGLENDVVLTMKQGSVAAPSRIVTDGRARDYFEHEGDRTAVSQRALQARADPWLGWTRMDGGPHDGVGFVAAGILPVRGGPGLVGPDEGGRAGRGGRAVRAGVRRPCARGPRAVRATPSAAGTSPGVGPSSART